VSAAKRFQPGHAYGGALAVIDTQRDRRAVCIVMPDPTKPEAAPKLADIFCETLNAMDEQAKRKPT
jgi:hypothetical protein